MRVKKLKGKIAVAFIRLFALFPWCLVEKIGCLVGYLMWWFPNRSRQVALINLSKCFPELSQPQINRLAKQTLINQGKTLAESACAWCWPPKKTLAVIKQVEGLDVLQRAISSGKGAVGITSHLGNWEILNHYYSSYCNPVIFYRPPKLKELDDFLKIRRVQMGNRVAPSTKEGILSVIKEIRRGGCAGIPADPEPARSSGVFVPFFATQVLTSKFVASMVAGHKAVAFVGHAIRLDDGSYKVIFEDVPDTIYSDDTAQGAAVMGKIIENCVRRWPTQYMWSMKRFKNRPEGEQRWY